MEIEIKKPIYDYVLKDLIAKLGLKPLHGSTQGSDILDFNIADAATFAQRVGTTLFFLTEVQKVINEKLKQ